MRVRKDETKEFIADVRDIQKIGQTVCAFLNTAGGTILCGFDDSGHAGNVQDIDQVRKILETQLQNAISPKALFTVSIDEEEDGLQIVSIEVPEGKDRPYVFEGGIYIRYGANTRPADAGELRNIVQVQAIASDRWERRPSLALDEDDLDHNEILMTVRDAERSGRFAFTDSKDDFAVLRSLAMVTSNGFTQAADVVFARTPARRHPQCRIRLARFASDKVSDLYEDYRWFEGPLVKIFEQIFEIIRTQVRTQSHFHPDEIRREDRPDYSLAALREGLVNAIAHRDYSSFSGGLGVSIYPNRIEIWNSGRLPEELKPNDLRSSHPSIPTNPDIAHVLYLRSLMERVGRGTQLIIASCKDLGAAPPKWEDRPTGVTLTIYAAQAGAVKITFNSRQQALLRELRQGDSIRLADYAKTQATEVSERQARRDLNELEEAGLLVREGVARATIYRRTSRSA